MSNAQFMDGIALSGLLPALLIATVKDIYAAAVFAVALGLLFYSKHKLIVPLVVAGAATYGS